MCSPTETFDHQTATTIKCNDDPTTDTPTRQAVDAHLAEAFPTVLRGEDTSLRIVWDERLAT